ncbi:MAG: polyprenol monophosphomannose synthase [Solirubrobacterales bacterium]
MTAPNTEDGAPMWLVVPTYNEASNIEAIVTAVRERLDPPRQVLVVDDSSPDGTGQIADRLAAEHSDVSVLHRPRKEGLGPAYVAGFREALAGGAQLVGQMDADFSHDPADLPRLVAASKDADLVLGSRYVRGGGVEEWGPLRRLISRGGCGYARAVLGVGVHDLTGGFKVFRREVLEAIDLGSISAFGYAFQVETTYRAISAGFRVVELPIVFRDRRVGESKMTRRIVLEAAWRVPAMRLPGNRVGPPSGPRS